MGRVRIRLCLPEVRGEAQGAVLRSRRSHQFTDSREVRALLRMGGGHDEAMLGEGYRELTALTAATAALDFIGRKGGTRALDPPVYQDKAR
ncbi:MAG TPA: hypothetical protein VGT04_09760 [Acidobacteriaceae bacterium]|nr:hypothetical protein [Acidobacteriaceae bacterium]